MYGLFRVYRTVASLVKQLVCFSFSGENGANRVLRDFNPACVVALQEAYLPPILQTTREMKATGSDDVTPPQLTRRKNYGATQNDHVIDASQLTPSSETVLTFTDEDRH